MGYYTVDHKGSTEIDQGKGKPARIVRYESGEPIEDVKKGDLEHVSGAEYHTGNPGDEEGE